MPNTRATIKNKGKKSSIGKPGGGGGPGGGGVPSPCALQTKLINTNKIEAKYVLFCTLIRR